MKKIILFVLLCLSLTTLQAAKFKCWTNSDGIKECGNSLPPQYVKQRVEFYNAKSGRVSEVTDAAKTDAQILAEKEQLKQQEKKQREERKQKLYDDVLLKTYLSIDDLLLSLQWKMTTLDSRINVTKGELSAANKNFLNYTRQAAQAERSGRKVNKHLTEDINNSRRKITNLTQRVTHLENEKTEIHTKFSHDIDRFVIARVNGLTLTLRDDDKARPLDSIQASCQNLSKCDAMWQSAKEYVKEQSDLEAIFNTTTVYTTISPQKADQLAYTISRTQSQYNNTKTEKFTLKIRCQPSRAGEELCKSKRVSDQLQAYKKRVELVHK